MRQTRILIWDHKWPSVQIVEVSVHEASSHVCPEPFLQTARLAAEAVTYIRAGLIPFTTCA